MMESTNKDEAKKLQKQFMQDVIIRIDETSKYIKPDEKTVEYAIMYLPSESVFNEVWKDESVISHALKKHVIVAGPATFYTYINFISLNLYQDKLSNNVDSVVKSIMTLQSYLSQLGELIVKLGKGIKGIVKQYDDVNTQYDSIENRVSMITSSKMKMIK
jgi:DNA recombination protein RmuC